MNDEVSAIKQEFRRLLTVYSSRKAVRDELEDQVATLQAEIEAAETLRDTKQKAILLITKAAEKAQESIAEVFELIVTPVLQHIFGDGYRLSVEWSRAGMQNASAEFRVISPYNGGEVISVDPRSKGGGVRDVVGFALRFSFLTMAQNKGLVVLDEAFSQLDATRFDPMAESLKYIQDKLQHQILFITHDQAYVDHADKVVRVSIQDGASTVTG